MSAHRRAQVTQVALRFWALLAVILALAIGSSIIALRLVAIPFLEDYQNRAMADQAQNAAQQMDERIGREKLLLRIVASDPNVIGIALGYADDDAYFQDLLTSLPHSDNLSWITFLDAFGDPVAEFTIRPDEQSFFAATELAELGGQIIDDPSPSRAPALVTRRETATYLAFGVPVSQFGLAEGALIAGYRITQGEISQAQETVIGAELVADDADPSRDTTVVGVPLTNLALTLSIKPDVRSVQAAGTQLTRRGATAVALVLCVAFAVFALLGRKVIIAPHQRLADQAERLTKQKKDLVELAAIAERANDAVLVTDLQGCLLWANPSFEALSGYRVADQLGQKPGNFLQCPETDPDTVAKLRQALANHTPVQVEILNRRKDGGHYWINLSISPLENEEGEHYGFMAISSDVTEARQSREELVAAKRAIEHQALHDPLTGLSNRRALDRALDDRARFENAHTTLVRIDLDHFKYVNDTMGHAAGDFILNEVSEILRHEIAEDDLAVRVGGDEFVLLLGPTTRETDGMALAKRILKRIDTPKQFEGKTVRVSASFGVAGTDGGLLDRDGLITGADSALYEAKEAGRSCVHLYTPDLHNSVLERRDLARELRQALAREEFEPFFQPQFDARTLDIVGVETLARWRSDVFGLVLPGRFLPIAAQLSILEEIDDQIIRKAIDQIHGLRADGFIMPKLAVNVTANRIQDRGVYDLLDGLPEDAPAIAFEVLESVLVEEQPTSFDIGLEQLRGLGVKIEVDDFGSGHASVVGLMHLRPDAMKIDQRLVMPILDDPVACRVLEQIVNMAKIMDLTVIAEGVETEGHANVLRDIGCDVLQGFYFCKPMPLQALRGFMTVQNQSGARPATSPKASYLR